MTGQGLLVGETHAVRGAAPEVVLLRSNAYPVGSTSDTTRARRDAMSLARWSGGVEAWTKEKQRSGRYNETPRPRRYRPTDRPTDRVEEVC